MEDLGIQKNGYVDPSSSTPGGRDKSTTMAGLANTFKELVSKAGTSFETSLGGLNKQAELASILHSSKNADPRNTQQDNADDHGKDLKADRPGDDRNTNRGENTRAENQDNSRPERADAHPQDRDSSRSGERNDDYKRGADNQKSDTETGARDNERGDTKSASNDAPEKSENNETSNQNQSNRENQQNTEGQNQGEAAAGATAGAAGQAAAQAGNANLDATAALVGRKAHAEQGNASETGKSRAGEGLATAQAAVAKQNGNHGKTTTNTHVQGQNNQSALAGSQQSQTNADPVAQAQANAKQQGAQLAKVIGGSDKTQVSVSVTNDAETLTSKPGSSLSATAFLASSKGKSQSQNSHQSNGNQANMQQNAQQTVAAAQGQVQQGQNQAQQNANQNAQIQAATQGGGDGKGAAQIAQGTQNAGATHAGGGESGTNSTGAANSANGPQQSQQAEKAAQTQGSANGKPANQAQPVADQISVKISKALQAGMDRISVQLRPAELGRVEVKMELGQDGRMLAVVTADNKDTLDLLKRDSGELQRALEDAGLQLDSGDLNFNLRGEEGELAEQQGSGSGKEQIEEDIIDDGILDPAIMAGQDSNLADGRIDVKA